VYWTFHDIQPACLAVAHGKQDALDRLADGKIESTSTCQVEKSIPTSANVV
jgi:hypothetical protein